MFFSTRLGLCPWRFWRSTVLSFPICLSQGLLVQYLFRHPQHAVDSASMAAGLLRSPCPLFALGTFSWLFNRHLFTTSFEDIGKVVGLRNGSLYISCSGLGYHCGPNGSETSWPIDTHSQWLQLPGARASRCSWGPELLSQLWIVPSLAVVLLAGQHFVWAIVMPTSRQISNLYVASDWVGDPPTLETSVSCH